MLSYYNFPQLNSLISLIEEPNKMNDLTKHLLNKKTPEK
ncbi:hypothetical protein RV08_GL001578 [Enterococcus mundtii]|nr:hypothetical protein RV08_GL001578 [Enterococcus mundtii]